MALFRWIKREWNTSQSCRRRDSEPAPSVSGRNSTNISNFNPQSRDEAYVRALKKFNEWRHKERTGSLRRSSRRSSKRSTTSKNQTLDKSTSSATNSEMMKQTKSPDNDNNVDGPLYEELKSSAHRLKSKVQLLDNAKKLLQKSQSFPVIGNDNNYNSSGINNHDTSVEAENTVNALKSSEKCPVINENDENEVMEFESNHCIPAEQIDLHNMPKQLSPPKKFFRDNSNPFRGVKSPIRVTRYRLATFASPNRLFNSENISIGDFVRDSLPRDDREPARIFESIPKPIKRKTYDRSPAAIYENEGKSNRCSQSPMYQRVINKHGDLVEYAIPFNDQYEEEFNDRDGHFIQDETNSSRIPSHLGTSLYQPEIQIHNSTERRRSRSLSNMDTYAEVIRKRENTIVTDLDKSDEKADDKFEVSDIFAELESLEKWSQRVSDEVVFRPSLSQIIKGNNLITCSTSDISQRVATLKSTMQSPIILSSGNFRRTTVSLRKIEKRFRIQSEQGLIHEFDILNKVKHPNVTLLMAVCLDVNNKILSLVLEPFILNINSMIYETDNKIMTEDCIEYILQVIKAVIYLHENGVVHSNICSHNILVCENRRVVKLSSFELATEVDSTKTKNDIINSFYGSFEHFQKSILKPSLNEDGLCLLIAKNKIPSEFLPYLVEYRKLYSEHYYQPPELLSSSRQFVFPTKQADVYSISLLLWEMLNMCVPFAIFSYEEIENLFQLNDTNQLPLFDGDRCEFFETLLKSGLTTFPFKRIDNVQSMKYLVDEARNKLLKHRSIGEKKTPEQSNTRHDSCSRNKNEKNGHLADRKSYGRINIFQMTKEADETVILEESSSKTQMASKSSTTNKYNSRSLDDILQADSTDDTRKQYEFHIEDFSLPSTPIARKNKLRRNAWLSNKTLNKKSFDESEEDALKILNNKNHSEQITSNKNKRINVNIKIIQNKINHDETQDTPNQVGDSMLNVSSQIDYWNSIATTPGEISLKKQNNSESYLWSLNSDLLRTPEGRIEDTQPKEQSTPRPTAPKPADRTSISKAMKERAKYYPNMPELLSETFLRRSSKRNADFESSLWKREKERCEKGSPKQTEPVNDGVERPLRTSVKDAVHKFESFTKIDILSRRRTLRSKSEDILNSFPYTSNAQSAASNRLLDEIESRLQTISVAEKTANLQNVDSTTHEDNITTTKLNVQLMNSSVHDAWAKLQSPNIVSTTTNEAGEKEISRLEVPRLAVEDVCIEEMAVNISPRKKQPTLFSINVRKINRRVSDIGCIRKVPKREHSLRHSICGTDLIKSGAKIIFKPKTTDDPIASTKPSKLSVTSVAESDIQHCKLTCWKCGSKVFKLDEIAFNEKPNRSKKFSRRFSTSPVSLDTSQNTAPTSSVEPMRSIEDIYIDDDFECDGSLGANMQLLNAEQDDLLDILSIDFMPSDTFEQFE